MRSIVGKIVLFTFWGADASHAGLQVVAGFVRRGGLAALRASQDLRAVEIADVSQTPTAWLCD